MLLLWIEKHRPGRSCPVPPSLVMASTDAESTVGTRGTCGPQPVVWNGTMWLAKFFHDKVLLETIVWLLLTPWWDPIHTGLVLNSILKKVTLPFLFVSLTRKQPTQHTQGGENGVGCKTTRPKALPSLSQTRSFRMGLHRHHLLTTLK